jgi:hypothetical protein
MKASQSSPFTLPIEDGSGTFGARRSSNEAFGAALIALLAVMPDAAADVAAAAACPE